MIKRNYPWIDAAKLLCAALVVFTHTYCYDLGMAGFLVQRILSPIAVPFFFITSGFFYVRGLEQTQDRKAYAVRYVEKNLTMYLCWMALTLPIAIWNFTLAHPGAGLVMLAAYLGRSLFFTGSMGVYWYILSLVCCGVLLYFADTAAKYRLLFLTSVVLWLIGVAFQAGALQGTILHWVIHTVFSCERNFLNTGLFYMMLGGMLSRWKRLPNTAASAVMLLASLCLTYAVLQWTQYQVMQAVNAALLFLTACSCGSALSPQLACRFRGLSTGIYLIHFPFILVWDYYLKKGTILDFCLTLSFSCAVYYLSGKLLPDRWYRALYGKSR